MFFSNALGQEGAFGIRLDCNLVETLVGIDPEFLIPLVAHELGHLYGLPHVMNNAQALMAPDGCCSRPAVLTAEDLDDWYQVHSIVVDKH